MQNQLSVILAGRFQPLHRGHLAVYKHLCQKFDIDSVAFASSNKQGPTSPLNFEQKKYIACNFFEVPEDKFLYCKIPYVPDEILNKTDKTKTVSIICLGSKDQSRLTNNKHYELLPNIYNLDTLKTSDIVSYIYISPMFANSCSATSIREQFLDNSLTYKYKRQLFVKLFGKIDQDIFDTLTLHQK